MDRFSQHVSQLKSYAARPEIATTLLMLGMLPGIALFNLAGAQAMTSMFGGMGVSMLLFGQLIADAPAVPQGAQRRAALIGAALIAYACGIHVAIYQLLLPGASAVAFDKLAGAALLTIGAFAAIIHTIWRVIRHR
jgi:hypothetical protein